MTRQDYRCSQCHEITELSRSLHDDTVPQCATCHMPLAVYFGRAVPLPMNMGWRGDGHYPTKVDSDIAKFQFKNL